MSRTPNVGLFLGGVTKFSKQVAWLTPQTLPNGELTDPPVTRARPDAQCDMAVVVKTNGIQFWGRCTNRFRTYFTGVLDVHLGYDLAFDPWPYV